MAYVILCWLSKHRKWRMNLSRLRRLSHLCDIRRNVTFTRLFSNAWKLRIFQFSPLAWPTKVIALFQGTMGESMTRGMSWAWCYGLTRNQAKHHTFVSFHASLDLPSLYHPHEPHVCHSLARRVVCWASLTYQPYFDISSWCIYTADFARNRRLGCGMFVTFWQLLWACILAWLGRHSAFTWNIPNQWHCNLYLKHCMGEKFTPVCAKCEKFTQLTFKDFSAKLFTSDAILLNHISTLVSRVDYWPSMDIILPSSLTQQ